MLERQVFVSAEPATVTHAGGREAGKIRTGRAALHKYGMIPESWKWCYVGDIFQHNTGKALNGSDNSGTAMTYITTSNLYWNHFELDKLKMMPFTETEVEKCTVKKGDLLVCEGGDYGRAAIWSSDNPMRIQNHIHRLRPFCSIAIKYFYYIFFLYKNAGMISGKGIGIQGLSSNVLHRLKIPLPPLAEQKRIVAKLEELLELIGKLKK
ncbi:restriction endonuclease subunit S [bacterium]|nr:restriction endonuclease subunit S [bacterium]